MIDAVTMKAARRLLAAADTPNENAEVSDSASLALALQAVLVAHTIKRTGADEQMAAATMISGVASAVGWILSMAPADTWDDGLDLLTRATRTAAKGHAQHEAGQPVTGRGH